MNERPQQMNTYEKPDNANSNQPELTGYDNYTNILIRLTQVIDSRQ